MTVNIYKKSSSVILLKIVNILKNGFINENWEV